MGWSSSKTIKWPFDRLQLNMASNYGCPKWQLLLPVDFSTFLNDDFTTFISFITLYIISTIIGICLLLWLIQQHTRSKYTSIALSIIFYFYFNIFRSILNFNINDSWEILQNSLLNTNFTVFLESFNDNFRYLVLSHVNIIMFSSFLLGQFIQNAKKINSAAVVIISLFLFIILYSYLPAILYTYAIIFGLLFWRYFTENDKTVFLILILLFIFCFVTNTFNNLYQIYMNVPQAVTQAHLNKITEWGLNNIFRHTDLLFSFLQIAERKKK